MSHTLNHCRPQQRNSERKSVKVSGQFWECECVILLPLRNYCCVAGHHRHTYHRRGRRLMTQRGHIYRSCFVLKADSDIILNFTSETLGLEKTKVKLNPAQLRYLSGLETTLLIYTASTENIFFKVCFGELDPYMGGDLEFGPQSWLQSCS